MNLQRMEPEPGPRNTAERDEELIGDPPPAQPEPSHPSPRKSARGFASMDRRLVSAIASKGGKAAHARGTAHEFTSEEAREAGRKGGQASHAKRAERARRQAGG